MSNSHSDGGNDSADNPQGQEFWEWLSDQALQYIHQRVRNYADPEDLVEEALKNLFSIMKKEGIRIVGGNSIYSVVKKNGQKVPLESYLFRSINNLNIDSLHKSH